MSKRLSILVVFLFIFSFSAAVFHHHDDGLAHQDCNVCVYSSNKTVLIDGDDLQLSVYRTKLSLISIEDDVVAPPVTITGISARAPPAVII